MELKKYKVCPSCGEHNRPTSLECKKCEMDLTGIRVVDSEMEQREREANDTVTSCADIDNTPLLVRICEECGEENPSQARKCRQCGEEISDILPVPVTPKNMSLFSYELKSVDGYFSAKLDRTVIVIGREAELSEYLGTKTYVSRQHAELTIVAGKVFIKNLSGTNKTFVNNEEIPNDEPRALINGDEIGLGGKVIADNRQVNAAYFVFREIL